MATGRKRTEVSLIGVEDLEQKLKRLTLDVQGEHLRAAVDEGAELVRERASQLAPRSATGSRGNPPGFMAESIETERKWTRTQDKAEAHVGHNKDAFYGPLRELGTVHQAPDPHLRPALDVEKENVVATVADHLRDRIMKTASQGAR